MTDPLIKAAQDVNFDPLIKAVQDVSQVMTKFVAAVGDMKMEFDDWLDKAEVRVSDYAGLDPNKVKCSTDYTSVWTVEYDGELTLTQTHWIAKWMYEQEGVNSLRPCIYDNTIRLYNEAVRMMAENVSTKIEKPNLGPSDVPTWHQRLQ